MDDYLYGFNNVCVFSSLIFITNIIISWYYNNYIYVFLFYVKYNHVLLHLLSSFGHNLIVML